MNDHDDRYATATLTPKLLLILRHVDHRFYGMSITHSTACRSLIPRDVDHPGASE